ncbi:LytR/AlgR family response regulator transcription factor [Flavihumibacter fluvii]|uniref:LytR/AlgR family response regulator transcription factor n=1 Tax=Flavihumibacter fluvii TaxID=2838157 RepID=UPI001BDF34D2|nr:LytTR family DNA-binding domain-containing protein [Flavihumibacter fluvii]ULQ51644.1 LytTR family DNA-binding domain-containing protein [Flavihumibacter fluvii]
MKILIIEDEQPAAARLIAALEQTSGNIDVQAVLSSVAESVNWLRNHEMPDLILMDIELTDGRSFRIFDEINIECPVIFSTAYDEYWQEAFEHNSIDYLLKPIKPEKLEAALKKYETLKLHFTGSFEQLKTWEQQPKGYKKRFLIKRGTDYISLKTTDIAYCYAAHKIVCLVDGQGSKYLLDKSLADLERDLDPAVFFRLNRKYLANINAILKLKSLGKGKLQVELSPPAGEEVVVSAEQTASFKDWMDA